MTLYSICRHSTKIFLLVYNSRHNLTKTLYKFIGLASYKIRTFHLVLDFILPFNHYVHKSCATSSVNILLNDLVVQDLVAHNEIVSCGRGLRAKLIMPKPK